MESRLLSALGKVAGIGGIALGVFLLLFRGVLEKELLPKSGLDPKQGYAIILSLMIFTFGIAGIGVIAWLIGRATSPKAPISASALGVLAGIGASSLFESTLQWEIKLTPQLLLFSGLFAAGIGIFFGYYPSRKASQLDPMAALRYE